LPPLSGANSAKGLPSGGGPRRRLLGLDRLDRAVLSALTRSFGGGPVGVSTLAVAVGEEATTVEEVREPFLVRAGMIARTPRSRSPPRKPGRT
jgi:holliday junction DNA helicase RuvB